ncbi:MAG TPA: RidA family protein [Allosphingosinicella sp.]|nr:RidA family protein [Allosphingosinicella sp.]
MRRLFGMGALLALPFAGASAQRPPVEHFGAPQLGGQPLPFSNAVRVGDVLYLSGQIGIGADGRLSEGIEAQTRQMMENIGAILRSAGRGWDDVFHCTAMLDNMADWPAFNRVYVGYFTPGRLPARSAFGTDGLALGALIELECQAYAGRARRR